MILSLEKYNVTQAKELPDGKTRWIRVGIAFEKDGKPPRIKLDTLPIPNKDGDVWLSLFEANTEPYQKNNNDKEVTVDTLKDDLPF